MWSQLIQNCIVVSDVEPIKVEQKKHCCKLHFAKGVVTVYGPNDVSADEGISVASAGNQIAIGIEGPATVQGTASDDNSDLRAQASGNGAIAQGPGATAAGAGGFAIGGNHTGNIFTGNGNR